MVKFILKSYFKTILNTFSKKIFNNYFLKIQVMETLIRFVAFLSYGLYSY